MFFMEKLLKVTPSVPVKPIPPPKPAESSNWSADFSSTCQLISTVPSALFGTTCGFIFSAFKKPNWDNSLCVRIMSCLLNFSPGMVLSSLKIT